MAKRPIFISDINNVEYVYVEQFEFEWFPGFAQSQKKLSINSLHYSFKVKYPTSRILEVSSKSTEDLGVKLSAFNLMFDLGNGQEVSVESAFQASKVFENGGPYKDILLKNSLEAKRDSRLSTSGDLSRFEFNNQKFELEPKTSFYDWLYVNALYKQKDLSQQVIEYDAFTDIEFNPKKSFNCQARSVALFVSLSRLGLIEEALSSIETFKKTVYKEVTSLLKNKVENLAKEHEILEQLKLDL